MIRSKEDIKQECIKRMEFLELHQNAIKEFKEDGILNESEAIGFLYWLNDKEKEIVKNFEKGSNCTVYHVIHNNTAIGEMYSMLYVYHDDEEWDIDWECLNSPDGISAIAAVYNKDMDLTDIGSIGIQQNFGGLMRTW